MRKFREQPFEKEPEEELPPAAGPRPPDAIDKMIAEHGPAAICAILAPILTEERVARIDAVLASRLGSVVPVVEDVYEPHNGAAVIRSAEALGLQELHILETGVRFQALRGITRGCHRWMDLARCREAAACVDALHARGFTVYATTPRGAIPLDAVDVSRPVAVVFGNEHAGLPDATIDACDGAVVFPMFGFTESFNLSVTAALVTSQLAARRRAFLGTAGDLDAARIAHLRARWFALKVRGALGIIARAVSDGTHANVAPGPQST